MFSHWAHLNATTYRKMVVGRCVTLRSDDSRIPTEMTGDYGSEEGRRSTDIDDRRAAQMLAFRLIYAIQTGEQDAPKELAALIERAERSGWNEVVRTGLFGRAIQDWMTGNRDPSTAVRALIDRSTKDSDPVMLAVGLALRSEPSFSESGAAISISREADLARAVVLLEDADSGAAERISAHTACGIAFVNRQLFELGDAQYAAALAIGEEDPAGLDFLLAPIMFNRAEAQVAWAAMLYQLRDESGVAERWQVWKSAEAATSRFRMPENWRTELAALGLLLGAMAREDTSAEARWLLAGIADNSEEARRHEGLLHLSLALCTTARASAGESVENAIRTLDQALRPQIFDLALYRAAALEADTGQHAGLRYGRRQLEEHWAAHLALLGAMESRIVAERLSRERDILTRHARLDALTGIGNRRAFEAYLADAKRAGMGSVGIILADLDGLKSINDQHGHLVGDAALQAVARTLDSGIRGTDLAIRLGGDEFAVLLANVGVDRAAERALQLLTQIDELILNDTAPKLTVSVSAGLACGDPSHIGDLLEQADRALYGAKAGSGIPVGRSRFNKSTAI